MNQCSAWSRSDNAKLPVIDRIAREKSSLDQFGMIMIDGFWVSGFCDP